MLLLFFSTILASAQDKYLPKYLTEKDDPLVKDAKTLTQNGWIELKEETSVAPDQFFERYAGSLGLTANPHLKFEKFNSETSQKGEEHQRYQLYYDGIKVEGLEFLLHAREGKVRSASGKVVSVLEMNTDNRLSETEAFESTQKALGVVGTSDDKERLVGELLITRVDIEDFSPKSFVLVYKFLMNVPKETSAFDVYVDAKTGKILKQIPTAFRCFSPLDGHEGFDNTKLGDGQAAGKVQSLNQPPQAATFIPIKSRYLQGQGSIPFQTELNSFNVQILGYETYANGMTWPGALTTKKYVNNNLIACFPNPADSPSTQTSKWSAIPQVTNSSINWQTNHQEATTAHWAVEKTYEYYKNIHNRGGVSTNHGVIGYVLTDIPQNAFCGFAGPQYRPFGTQTNYPNGGIGLITIQSRTGESWATLDILAHEYTHGVTRMTSNLLYQGESGALNEAFSDLIGYCVERRTLPNDWNWLVGEDIAGVGRALRNMQNPGSTPLNTDVGQVPQPDTYLGTNWHGTSIFDGDNGGVHFNSGVMNHWFYLLVSGGTNNGITVNGIQFDRAEAILYDAFAHRMGSQAMYADARTATLDAAISLYGTCSNEHRQVGEAWAAVGVGTGAGCAADCNLTVSASVSNNFPTCGSPITLTANCTGSGCTGTTYTWTGPNMTSTSGQTITVNSPNSPGIQTYYLSANKPGCNFNIQSVTVTTNCAPPLSNGCYTIKAKHSNKFMQPENGNNGARIRQYSANGQNNQIFELEGVDSDAYKIKAWGTNRVWEAAGAGTGYQTGIQIWDYSGGNHQKWLLSTWGDGSYRLAPKHAQTILADVEGVSTADGAGLHLWGQHAGDNQRFIVSSVGCPSTQPNCNFSATTNPSTINTSPNGTITLNASCWGSDCGGVSYQWSGNGANSSSSSYTLNAPGSAGTYTYTMTLSKPGCSNSTANVTVNVNGTPPPPSLCAEAESSGGNGPITGDPNASGGSTRGAENNFNHYVDYTVTVPSAGSYTLALQYYALSGPTLQISVIAGGSGSQSVSWPSSGSWNIVHTTQNATVNLAAGSNTIRIQGTGGGSCRQDKICVSGNGGGCNTPTPSLAANPSSITSGQSSTLTASGCSGTVTWSNGLGTGNSKTVNPSSTTTYTATCTANGCTSGSGSVTVTVNGGGGSINQCVEAENSGGNGPITGDPNASGGSTRGAENNYNHYVDYAVTVPSAGNYTLALQYYASSGPTLQIAVTSGGSGSQSVSWPSSGSWNIVHTTQNATVNLAAGSNTIRIQGTGGGSCRQDKICVTGNGTARLGMAEEFVTESPELTVSPNPNSGEFEASFYVEPGRQATLSISDMQGREVWQKKLTGVGTHRESVRLPNQSVGSYILLLHKEATDFTSKAEYKKVIVVK